MIETKKEKTAQQIIAEAKKISMEHGDSPGALDLLINFLSQECGNRTWEEKIEVFGKAAEYQEELKEHALALREKAEGLFKTGKYGSAIIEAQKSLEIFEKYGPKISAGLTRSLIVKINKKMDEEMK